MSERKFTYLITYLLKDESLIIRVDDIKKLTNGVVFGVIEKFKVQAGEVINKDIQKHLPLQTAFACRVIKMF